MTELERALAMTPIASVQNRYSAADRASDSVLELCERRGIAFIPWASLARGELTRTGGRIGRVARRHGATPGQVALSWLVHRSPVTLPIPGTSSLDHLEENARALDLRLGADEVDEIASQVLIRYAARRFARRARVRAGRLKEAMRAGVS